MPKNDPLKRLNPGNEPTNKNWDNFLKAKLEMRKSVFFEQALKLRQDSSFLARDINISDADSLSINSEKEIEARQTIQKQKNMIVVCEAESDGVIYPDRPIGFPDLDYRLDLRSETFSEREI